MQARIEGSGMNNTVFKWLTGRVIKHGDCAAACGDLHLQAHMFLRPSQHSCHKNTVRMLQPMRQ
jgi:hypothetical protein